MGRAKLPGGGLSRRRVARSRRVGVEDVEVIYRDLKARGVPIRMPPTNYSWALEMQIEDPDGNVLRLGSEPRPE